MPRGLVNSVTAAGSQPLAIPQPPRAPLDAFSGGAAGAGAAVGVALAALLCCCLPLGAACVRWAREDFLFADEVESGASSWWQPGSQQARGKQQPGLGGRQQQALGSCSAYYCVDRPLFGRSTWLGCRGRLSLSEVAKPAPSGAPSMQSQRALAAGGHSQRQQARPLRPRWLATLCGLWPLPRLLPPSPGCDLETPSLGGSGSASGGAGVDLRALAVMVARPASGAGVRGHPAAPVRPLVAVAAWHEAAAPLPRPKSRR